MKRARFFGCIAVTLLGCGSGEPTAPTSATAGSAGSLGTGSPGGGGAGGAGSAGSAGLPVGGGGSSGAAAGGTGQGGAGGGVGGAAAGAAGVAASGSAGVGGTAGAAGAPQMPPACTSAGTELCEDFESGQLDTQKWKLTKPTGSASITIDGQHTRSGTHAAHIQVVAGQQSTAMLTESVTFPASSNSFYARAYFYFAPDLPTAQGGDFHMGFIFGIGKNDAGDVQAGMGMIGGERQYLGYSIFFGPPKYEFGPWSQAKVPHDQWQCIELFEDGSSPSEEKRQVWLDGVELMDLRSTSNNNGAPANHKPPAFSGVSFGVWEYHPTPLLSDIWMDDIRVSKSPIGCD